MPERSNGIRSRRIGLVPTQVRILSPASLKDHLKKDLLSGLYTINLMIKRGLAILIVVFLMLSQVVIAPSHPVELILDEDGNPIGTKDILTGEDLYYDDYFDAGITPDNFFYFIDEMFNLFQDLDEVEAEKLAEMKAMIEQGRYEEAEELAEDIKDIMPEIESDVKQVDGFDNLIELIEYETMFISYDHYISDLKAELIGLVDSGTITSDVAESIGISDLQEEITEFGNTVEEHKEEFIVEASEESGKTQLEIELETIKPIEEAANIEEFHKGEIIEDFATAEKALAQIESEFEQARIEGEEIPNEVAFEKMIEEAKIRLQISESSFEYERYGHAFGQLNAAEHLILNADRFLKEFTEEEISAEEKVEIDDELTSFDEQIELDEDDRVEEAESFVEEYEPIKDKYPEFEGLKERYEKIMALAEKLSDQYSKEFESLKIEGKSEEEATIILIERFGDEYRKAYGEEFIPPGITYGAIDEKPLGRFKQEEDVRGIGGFVEDYTYEDPLTGYKYSFKDDGYKYITPSGLVYEEKYREGYIPPKAYTEGNEIYTYEIKEVEGTTKYEYTTTGYTVTTPDGKTETFAYPEGKYEVPDGDVISIESTGYEFQPIERHAIKYYYNPEFNNYISSTGNTYTPSEGAYIHGEYTDYAEDTKDYVYSYGGESWTYDTSTNIWTSYTGETYTPSSTTVAPVGHEDAGGYTTQSGDKWTYDSATGTWTSSGGEAYTSSSGDYVSASGTSYSYSYDPVAGSYSYTDSSGSTYSGSYESGSYSGEGGMMGGDSGSYSGGGDSGGGDSGGGSPTGYIIYDARLYRSF